ncbi:MAG: nucleotidyltransferase family protein [Paracoccaceae bacterium]
MIVTLIPAAGASSRMGAGDKLLETIKGEPILARTARIALEAGLGPVLVTLRPKDNARQKAIRKHDVTLIEIADADEGMSASLRAGAKAALSQINDGYKTAGDNEYLGMMVLLPDMPEISTDDLKEMDLAHQSSGGMAVRAINEEGQLGHPTLFPDHMLAQFAELVGDKGAAKLIEEPVIRQPIRGARLDLDTPEDWAAWRAKTNTPF